ncbi:MAG: hypothetical protein JJE52_06460 [Acidimicrobiia bacterium]|nr:hypothetical protein [Acidimicrobiia bacterium]
MSKMIRGPIAVTVERIVQIEDVRELPRGQILTWAGLVDIDAIEHEPPPTPVVALPTPQPVDMAAEATKGSRKKAARAAKANQRRRPRPPVEKG